MRGWRNGRAKKPKTVRRAPAERGSWRCDCRCRWLHHRRNELTTRRSGRPNTRRKANPTRLATTVYSGKPLEQRSVANSCRCKTLDRTTAAPPDALRLALWHRQPHTPIMVHSKMNSFNPTVTRLCLAPPQKYSLRILPLSATISRTNHIYSNIYSECIKWGNTQKPKNAPAHSS